MTSRGKRARQKGLQFERDIAIALRRIFPHARRKLENHREDAAAGTDIMHTGRWLIQCKKLARYAPIERIFEIKCDQTFGDVPVLVTAGTNKQTMAILPWDVLLDLIEKAESV